MKARTLCLIAVGFFSTICVLEANTQGNANQYIDQVIQNVKAEIQAKGLDPLPLDNVQHCSGCVLHGLTSLHRTGDATLTTRGEETVVLDVNLGLGEIRANCNCHKRIAFIKIGGRVWGRIRNFSIHGRISQNTEQPEIRKLESFTITNEGSLDVGVSGGGIKRIINEGIMLVFRGKIKSKLRSTIRDKVPELVRKAVENNKGFKL